MCENDLISSIDDSDLTASSTYDQGYSYAPHESRFNSSSAWEGLGVGHWIQAEFNETKVVVAVRTKRGDGSVSAYMISISLDGDVWNFVKTTNGSNMVFNGNAIAQDRDDIVINKLPSVIEARFVRLTLVSFESYPSIRWAIDGCATSFLSTDY